MYYMYFEYGIWKASSENIISVLIKIGFLYYERMISIQVLPVA